MTACSSARCPFRTTANAGGRWRARTADLLLVSTLRTTTDGRLRTITAGRRRRPNISEQARTTATARKTRDEPDPIGKPAGDSPLDRYRGQQLRNEGGHPSLTPAPIASSAIGGGQHGGRPTRKDARLGQYGMARSNRATLNELLSTRLCRANAAQPLTRLNQLSRATPRSSVRSPRRTSVTTGADGALANADRQLCALSSGRRVPGVRQDFPDLR